MVLLSILLRLGCHLNFHGICRKIILDSILVGTGYILDGFIILYIELDEFIFSSIFLLITSSNDDADVNVWHARLGHVGKGRMYRPKEGFWAHSIELNARM